MVENRKWFSKILSPLFVGFGYLFLYLPMLVMILFSFNSSSSSANWTGFSFRWYVNLFYSAEMLELFYLF